MLSFDEFVSTLPIKPPFGPPFIPELSRMSKKPAQYTAEVAVIAKPISAFEEKRRQFFLRKLGQLLTARVKRLSVRQHKRSRTKHLRVPLNGLEFMLADPCAYCGGVGAHFDHIEPLYRGGKHEADNLARVCWPCNRQKNTQPLLKFLARRVA